MSQPEISTKSLSSSLAEIAAHAAPAIVSVRSHRSRSSGFVWRDGLIVTSDEALSVEGEVAVTLANGETAPATLIGCDASTDIALLRVDRSGMAGAKFSQVPPRMGELTLALGADDGRSVAAFGIVSHAGPAWRSMRGGQIDKRLELDLRLRRASAGGLAFNLDGEAIGMVVAGPRRNVLVIPAATIERVASRLQSHGRIARGYLGLALQSVRLADGAPGVMAMSVDSASPAATAGLLQGDVIVGWNGDPVRGVRALLRELGPESVGQTVNLSLQRAGAQIETRLTIGERPQP